MHGTCGTTSTLDMQQNQANRSTTSCTSVKLSPNILTLTEGPSRGQKVGDSLVARCVRVFEVLHTSSRMPCGRIRNSMLRTHGYAISETTPLLRLKLLHFFAIPSNDSQRFSAASPETTPALLKLLRGCARSTNERWTKSGIVSFQINKYIYYYTLDSHPSS